jgi:cation transport regulator
MTGRITSMPYASDDDLPARVSDHLPEHAQDIFREAFNNAWRARANRIVARRSRTE